MFVNTLALRSQVEGEDTFAALLSQVKATCLEAYERQDTPFEKVVDMLRPQRNLAINPIFQVMVILHNVDMGGRISAFSDYPLESGTSKIDLTAAFTETPEGLAGGIEYSPSVVQATDHRAHGWAFYCLMPGHHRHTYRQDLRSGLYRRSRKAQAVSRLQRY